MREGSTTQLLTGPIVASIRKSDSPLYLQADIIVGVDGGIKIYEFRHHFERIAVRCDMGPNTPRVTGSGQHILRFALVYR